MHVAHSVHFLLNHRSQQCISHQPHLKELSMPLQFLHTGLYDMRKHQGYCETQLLWIFYPYQFPHNHIQYSGKSSHVPEVLFHNHYIPANAVVLQAHSPLFRFFDYTLLPSLSQKNTADKLQYVQTYHWQCCKLTGSRNKSMDYPSSSP